MIPTMKSFYVELIDSGCGVNPPRLRSCAASQLGAFDAVVKQMLEDVQERLVYRTHIYIQTDIVGYNPAPGDLAYPEKLEMMEVRALY